MQMFAFLHRALRTEHDKKSPSITQRNPDTPPWVTLPVLVVGLTCLATFDQGPF